MSQLAHLNSELQIKVNKTKKQSQILTLFYLTLHTVGLRDKMGSEKRDKKLCKLVLGAARENDPRKIKRGITE